ncbi:MAG: hypothetical protein IJW44_01530 [Clostridia bacterium]|nr:hypothetical protein [Clostridia bacterium]
MEIRKILKKMLSDTALYFTCITVAYALLMIVVNVNEEEILLSAMRLVLNFIFAALAALAQGIYRMKNLHGALRLVAHYGILALAFYLCFLLSLSLPPAQVLIGMVAFTLIYATVMGIGALLVSRFRKNAKEEETYQSQFKKQR